MMRALHDGQGLFGLVALVLFCGFVACTPSSSPSVNESESPRPRTSAPETSPIILSTDAATASSTEVLPPASAELQPSGPATFLGQTEPVSLAIADFEVRGRGLPPDIGKSVPDRLTNRLTSRKFQLVERSRLNRVVQEHDLQSAGIVGGSSEPLTKAAYILLGSVSFDHGVEVSARLVEVRTAKISRRAWADTVSLLSIDAALDQVAAVLSASDEEYERLDAVQQRRQEEALKHTLEEPLTVTREGNVLFVTICTPSAAESEQRLYQQVRQQLREQFAKYCKNELGNPRSKDWLMDFCRQHEDCTNVTTGAGYKTFSFHVPLPP